MSTLEDVFINVSKLTKAKNQIKYDLNEKRIDDEEKREQERREKNYLILYDDSNYNVKYSYCSKILLDTKVSFKKRFIQIYRDKKTFFLEILCPILLALIGCFVCYLRILEKNQTLTLNIGLINEEKQTMYYYPAFHDNEEIKKIFGYSQENHLNIDFNKLNVEYDTSKTKLLVNFMKQIHETEKYFDGENYGNYIFNSIDKINQKYEVTVLADILLSHSPPIYLDYIMKSIIRYAVNKPNLQIEVVNEPLPYT